MKRFEGMLPDFMGLRADAENEDQAREIILRSLLKEITKDDLVVWSVGEIDDSL